MAPESRSSGAATFARSSFILFNFSASASVLSGT
jgi:hypothetical protein